MNIGSGEFGESRTPPLSLVLGIGPMAMLPLMAVLAWTLPQPWPLATTWLAIGGGAILLLFLAGVRRGLSFHTPGGARLEDLLSMLWLFAMGAGAMLVETATVALGILMVGFASLGVLDREAARRGQAPAFFATLRPVQAAIALAGLLALFVHRLAIV